MHLVCERGAKYEYVSDAGERFFSVSQVRRVMFDGLSRVDFNVLEGARIRGELMHIYFSMMLGSLRGVCDTPEHLPQHAGYCRAINQWVLDTKPRPKRIETTSCNRKLGIAGTRDADVELVDGVLAIVDLKTGAPDPTDAAQLLAYQSMEGCESVKKLYDLRVHEDGTYRLEEVAPLKHQAEWAAFLNALQITKWRATL